MSALRWALAAVACSLGIAGCGGSGSVVPARLVADTPAFATLVHVDMTAGTVTYSAVSAPGQTASSRAVIGTAVAPVTGPTTIATDGGDPQVFTLAMTITNNYGAPYGQTIGQFPTNISPVSGNLAPGLRAIITQFINILPAPPPTPVIQISNADGFVPGTVTTAAGAASPPPPAPYLIYPAIQPAGSVSQTGAYTANPSNKQTRLWNFVVPKGVTSFSFMLMVEGPTANETPPESEASTTYARVSTFAGSLTQLGFVDGIATVAQFAGLGQVAADASGNLYVADGHAVRRITPAGTVNTIANPNNNSITGDAATIQAYTASIYMSTAANIQGAKSAMAPAPTGDTQYSYFAAPVGVAVDPAGDTVYVSDYAAKTIVRLGLTTGADPTKEGSWTPSVIAGSISTAGVGGQTATAANASFNGPRGIALGPSGDLYVADSGGNRVWRMTFNGVPNAPVSNSSNPYPIPAAAQYINWTATVLAGNQSGVFNGPSGITVNQAGTVFVCDTGSSIIHQITSDGTVTTIAGGVGTSPQFNKPQALVCDAAGYLYVADTGNNVIRRIALTNAATSMWTVATVAGKVSSTGGAIDGPATSAQFNMPTGIAVDGSGNLYVADSANDAIRLIQRVIPGS